VPLDGAAGIDGLAAAEADEAGALAADDVAAAELGADVLLLDELEHAAASSATGTRADAVQTNRIFLATGGHSFTQLHARACGFYLARWCVRARDRGGPRSGRGDEGAAQPNRPVT
jgi:hypothetical protein